MRAIGWVFVGLGCLALAVPLALALFYMGLGSHLKDIFRLFWQFLLAPLLLFGIGALVLYANRLDKQATAPPVMDGTSTPTFGSDRPK
jgi:hypothetical protein